MAWVVETFGRYDKVLEPGLRFLIPLVQRVSYVFSLKEEAISVPSQTAITRDNVSVSIDGVLFVKVTDAYRAAYGVEDPHFAVTQLAQTTMRSEIGKITLDRMFEEREARVVAAIESHYSIKGVIKQITRFMLGAPGGDLQCRRIPESVRGHLNCSHYKGWC